MNDGAPARRDPVEQRVREALLRLSAGEPSVAADVQQRIGGRTPGAIARDRTQAQFRALSLGTAMVFAVLLGGLQLLRPREQAAPVPVLFVNMSFDAARLVDQFVDEPTFAQVLFTREGER